MRHPATRWALGLLAGLFIVLLVLSVSAHLLANHFLRSPGFRDLLARELGRRIGVSATLEGARWSGLSLYADSFQGTGLPGSPVAGLQARQLRADLQAGPLFSRQWLVQEIRVQTLSVVLSPPATTPALPPAAVPPPDPQPFPWLARLLPTEVVVERIVIEQADARWDTPVPGSLNGTRAEILREPATWRATLRGGDVQITGLPVLQLETAGLRINPPRLHVLDARFTYSGGGTVTLAGDADFSPDGPSRLHSTLQALPAGDFLPRDWRARFTGLLHGNATWSSHPATGKPPLAGNLWLEQGRLEALPVLDLLADSTRMREFRSLRLDTARARFERDVEGQWRIGDLRLESEALACVEGTLSLRSGILQGQFEVGLIPESLRWLPGARDSVFTRPAGGYLWAAPPMRIGGTLDKPSEDLSPRLKDAAFESLEQGVREGIDSLLNLLR